MSEQDHLAEAKRRRAIGQPPLWPQLDWLIEQVENTDNRIENMAAKLDNQRRENARLNQQIENLKAEVRRRQGWMPPKEVARLREQRASSS